jgi:hypothetical protein
MTEFTTLERRQIARWSKLITKEWQKPVHAYVNTGRLLIRSHHDLIAIHGAWSHMVRNILPFGHATAKKLMAIAKNPVLSNGSHENRLPANWTTLYALSRVNPAVLLRLIERGVVNPRTERDEAEQMQELDLAAAETFEPTVTNRDDDSIEAIVHKLHHDLTRLVTEMGYRLNHGEPLTDREQQQLLAAAGEMTGAVNLIDRLVRPMPTVKRLGERR